MDSNNPFGRFSSTPLQHQYPIGASDLLSFDTPPKGEGVLPRQDLDSTNPFAMVAELNNRTQPGLVEINCYNFFKKNFWVFLVDFLFKN
jgi:hypothetical protein